MVLQMHATKTGTPSSKRAPTAQQLQSSCNNNNNSDSNDAYMNNMNNNSNINLPPECSALLESPTPYYYGRNNRQYEWTLNSPPQQQYQGHHQQQQQLKQPPPLPFAAAMVSPPTPDKPSAWKTTLKHANTATAEATHYYTQPQQQQHHHHQHQQQHVKKRVHFTPTAKVHPIDSLPKASDMSPKEKATIWYLENDYNKFKHDAASDGGVKIIRRVSVEAERMKKSCGGHYVLIGSFDGDTDTAAAADRKSSSISNNNDGSNHSSDAATAGYNRSSPSGKFYNEHEYNDYIKANGQMVCKRGLGYHFSRIRKRNRAMTRSAVLAWQKSMEKEANKKRIDQLVHRKMQASSSSSGSGMHKSLPTCTSNIHSQVVIALVSSKCSRVSREEALWRGNVDFRVAYPERRYLHNLHQPEENMTMQSSLFHQHGGFNVDYNIEKKRSSSISGGDLVLDDELYHSTKKRRSNVYDSSTTSAAAGYAEV